MSSFVLVNQRVANYLKNKYINNLTLRKTYFWVNHGNQLIHKTRKTVITLNLSKFFVRQQAIKP